MIGLGTSLGSGDHVVLHLIAFFQGLVTVRLYGRIMNEDVGSTVAAKKTITLGVIEPAHYSTVL